MPRQCSEVTSAFVNCIAHIDGPRGEHRGMGIGGVVVSVAAEVIQTISQVPAEALGITRFQWRDGERADQA